MAPTITMTKIFERIQRDLAKLKASQTLSIRTFKKDRGLKIIKHSEDTYDLAEDGFQSQCFNNLSHHELFKKLESVFSREFPRSNRVHYKVS